MRMWCSYVSCLFLTESIDTDLATYIDQKHSIMGHLRNFNILYNYQYGFRDGHSSETQLITVVKDILASYREYILCHGSPPAGRFGAS